MTRTSQTMDSNTHVADDLRFPRAAQAALDGFAEGVLVFDLTGNLLYGNAAARRLLDRFSHNGPPTRDQMLTALAPLGARVVPLTALGHRIADAVYVPASPAGDTLASRERRAIVETLEATGWKLSETARALGISRTTLWRRLRAWGLARDVRRQRATSTVDG